MEQSELTLTAPDGADSEQESDPIVSPTAAPDAPQAQRETQPVIVIRRTTFNYVFIAIVFLLLGVFIGWFSAFRVDRANRAWVTDAISVAMAEQADTFAGLVASNRAPSLDDPTSRFDVAATSEYYRGSAEATVEMIEFGDFNCGFCGRFQAETFNKIIETYGDQVRFVYRDYPILADTSVTAALAARCAGEQGQFWEYHDLLYANQGTFNQAGAFAQLAGQLELDVDAFNTCVEDQRYLSGVVADYNEARDLGIRGTPAFFINGRPISGAQPFDVFAGVIEEELAANIDTPDANTSS
ncbi:MAG: DsbA family protein [Anaerolineae bacterium]|nr:DsbA family protein [Anaerolineae bacterium]